MSLRTSMADPHDYPQPVDAMVSSSVGRQEPDPRDAEGGMRKEAKNESRHSGGSAGPSEHGEGGMKVTETSSAECGRGSDGSRPSADAPGSGPKAEEICREEVDLPAPKIVSAATGEGAVRFVYPNWEVAERRGEWFKAIEARDCLSLMNIINAQVNDASRVSLCLKTGEQCRTALHVAAMQGCYRLAKQLIDLMRERYPSSEYSVEEYCVYNRGGKFEYNVYNLSEIVASFIYNKDGRSGLSAFEMANDIIGHTSISQYILYVGPLEWNTEYSGMYEAYEGTEWHRALARGDCRTLKSLLIWNSHLLLETCGELSVLDVAIVKGDKELVEQVMKMFLKTSDGRKVSWHKESYFPSELKWEQIAERSFSRDFSKLKTYQSLESSKKLQHVSSTLELAKKFGRSEEIKKLLQNVDEHSDVSGGVIDQERIQDLLSALSEAGFFENGVGSRPPINGESVELEASWSEVEVFESIIGLVEDIQKYWKVEWSAEFMADVDYNFEDKRSLRFSMLRMHYAFKHPRQCHIFINRVGLCAPSCGLDGRGRSPFQVMVDHYNPKDFGFDEVEYFQAHYEQSDARGRGVMTRAITKQFLEQNTMVSSHFIQRFETYGGVSSSRFLWFFKNLHLKKWLFITSILFEDVDVLRSFSNTEKLKIEIKAILDGVDVSSPHFGDAQITSILIAAAIGNQTLLRECFKYKPDCMVEDKEGRTALHYAANPNALTFIPPPTSFFCSIEYPKKIEEEWVTRRKAEEGNLNGGQHANGNPQSNASVGRKACILMLLQAGVDLIQADKKGNIPDPSSSSDAEFQSWWYNILVKDAEDKKNSFNQAGNALSVVGTLVAATSYVGPLQPPLNYAHDGYVDTSRSLAKVFMWTNTLAFYLAVASVMFAVVPSLPMPQEGVLDELRRARHTVSSSLFLLLASIGCILVSFAAATAVVIDNRDYYGEADFLLSPSLIGWFFCVIAMVSFSVRVMRLVFYRNSTVRHIYKFSFSDLLKRAISYPIPIRYRLIISSLAILLLILPVWLEHGLIWMIFATRRGLKRLWKERIKRQERRSPTAQEEGSSELPRGPILIFLRCIDIWVDRGKVTEMFRAQNNFSASLGFRLWIIQSKLYDFALGGFRRELLGG